MAVEIEAEVEEEEAFASVVDVELPDFVQSRARQAGLNVQSKE